MRERLPAISAGLTMFLAAVSGQAATIEVNSTLDAVADDGVCTLREAVIAANNDFPSGFSLGECPPGNGADKILLPIGVYGLTILGAGEDFSATGDLDVLESLEIVGAGQADQTVVDAQSLDRVFFFSALAAEVSLKHLTVRGGYAVGYNVDGGGIYTDTPSLILQDVIVKGNDADDNGGGIYIDSGTVVLEDVVIEGNYAGDGGGGINIYNGAIAIRNSEVSSNEASVDGGGVRVGYYADQFSLDSVIVTGNLAGDDGGGIYHYRGGACTIIDSTISENWSADQGGGLLMYLGTCTMRSSIVVGNAADDGGGIYHYLGDLRIESSSFTSNESISTSDEIYCNDIMTLRNVTMYDDTPLTGGALYNSGSIDASNTLIFGQCTGLSVGSSGGNMESPGFSCDLADPTDLGGVLPGALGLLPLADNGGPTLTHMLDPSSPAVDGGRNLGCAAEDQRGVIRPQDGDEDETPVCDVGAVELVPCLAPETLNLTGGVETGTKTYEACGEIVAGTAYTIDAGADITFLAGASIRLQDGFTVAEGGLFHASVERLADWPL